MTLPLLMRHRIKSLSLCKFLNICIFLFVGALITLPQSMVAQEQNDQWKNLFEDVVESIAQRSDVQLDYTYLLEQLEYLNQNPVNLNDADLKDLERLIMLNSFQVKSLQKYLDENGPVFSLYELQFIYGFDQTTAKILEPFISFNDIESNPQQPIKKPLKYGRHQLIL